ncbi:MAG TPA: hypothetical protein VFO07_06030 [Roseiflexaceae bacterium]|nr:hypothetical protein [Roseiflexaceae bacterium]HEU5102015.1 hypothetical protein [Roseiflexaceae bacterium]
MAQQREGLLDRALALWQASAMGLKHALAGKQNASRAVVFRPTVSKCSQRVSKGLLALLQRSLHLMI